ncbi:uncharacterized protein LOC117122738 [Anneissia japonica]|uniref:uncharacterized protein LOC117122738 n=1 Tax=Anneissia japonica TaxID=1529436 RepID=UPI0014256BA2|nr:uncharacterized protein LOC117122738 [Anneissia japonica]
MGWRKPPKVPGVEVDENLYKLKIKWEHILPECNVKYQVTYALITENQPESYSTTRTVDTPSLLITNVLPNRQYNITIRATSNGKTGPEIYTTATTRKKKEVSEVAVVYVMSPLFIVVAVMTFSYKRV